jgi:hypothetical protein
VEEKIGGIAILAVVTMLSTGKGCLDIKYFFKDLETKL